MNLVTFRARLRGRVGNPTLTDKPDTIFTDAVNSAYSDVMMKYKFHKARKLCDFNTVVDTVNYGLPTDCFALFRVRNNTTGKYLKKLGDNEWSRRIENVNTTQHGRPEAYIRFRDWITLDPPPDDVYQIELWYKAIAAPLAQDADVPLTPSSWDEGILRLAKFYYWETFGDEAKAIAANQLWKDWVADMPTEIDDETDKLDNPVIVASLADRHDRPHDEHLDWDRRD